MDAENEGVENYGRVTINAKALPTERKGYRLSNSPTTNYNDERDNQSSMIWTNLIVGDRANRNVAKAYVNAVNAIATFVCPTPSTNIITNYTIRTQYSIKPGL